MQPIGLEEFEGYVADALDGLPPELGGLLENVVVVIAGRSRQRGLLGLYEGVPLTERGSGYTMVLPDKITIFRGPLERACRSPAEITREVRITVVHELAHHLGFEEERLDDLGLA